jgi:single-stranded-DNA-specific exonuclease
MKKRWTILADDKEQTNLLQKALNVHPVLCKILSQRGLNSFDKAKDFFRPQLTNLHDPWLMKDMDKAVERVLSAVNSQEKILVFGDYDVDGTTSVASMYRFLRTL